MSDAATAQRSVVLASADVGLRSRLRESLTGMRWRVREAGGGAEAMALLDEQKAEALLVDSWLPDLEVSEFAAQIRGVFPQVDMLRLDGDVMDGGLRSPRRHELLHAIREAQEREEGGWAGGAPAPGRRETGTIPVLDRVAAVMEPPRVFAAGPAAMQPIAEMIGNSPAMLELARLIRLVAPRSTAVLIEGETGTGKEVVAKALHRLGSRSGKPFAVLNCAAIPEALLEAELFGHTRGAFTGAVQSRTGRIEAAHGGTLFLDEIGEMPLALQAKMLRFLECGELQRVGDNETMRVDVRVIAATHQHLEERSATGEFRLDLYHRLAVFPLEVPALRERSEDIPALSEHFLAELGKESPRKRLARGATEKLQQYRWPGNVRELAHVLERGVILAGDAPEIGVEEIRLRSAVRG